MIKQYWKKVTPECTRGWGLKKQGRLFRNKDRVRLEVTKRQIGPGMTFGAITERFAVCVYDDATGIERVIEDNFRSEIEAVTEAAQLFKLEKW